MSFLTWDFVSLHKNECNARTWQLPWQWDTNDQNKRESLIQQSRVWGLIEEYYVHNVIWWYKQLLIGFIPAYPDITVERWKQYRLIGSLLNFSKWLFSSSVLSKLVSKHQPSVLAVFLTKLHINLQICHRDYEAVWASVVWLWMCPAVSVCWLTEINSNQEDDCDPSWHHCPGCQSLDKF